MTLHNPSLFGGMAGRGGARGSMSWVTRWVSRLLSFAQSPVPEIALVLTTSGQSIRAG